MRLRELGVSIGDLPTGPLNAVTDVPGVSVGHTTVIRDQPSVARTGVTVIYPRPDIWTDHAYAAFYGFSGNGEMTGLPWIAETGLLGSPVALTNTHQVGLVRDTLVRIAVESGVPDAFHLPVVSETWDGWLNDIDSFPLTEEDVRAAVGSATAGPVPEGCVGGGTGMICHEFKGGIGTSSRVVEIPFGSFTLGVLVQANYGRRADLRIDGVPVGRMIPYEEVPSPWESPPLGGSIVVVAVTDAPLLPIQCHRIAKRVTVGLGRVGGYGHDSSGDLFLVISTGNHPARQPRGIASVPSEQLDPLFHAVADATEEAIVNALLAATTMIGHRGRVAYPLPADRVEEILERR
ncbi:MAG: D-aminopeptidase [Acidimicrobiia bacterium]|nr:MAG: D-aminopeptidase [Acidimicrobiia bacterium]